MTIAEGAKGDQVLRVELPDGVDLGKFDFTDAANPSYRVWRVPAALINEHETVTLMAVGHGGEHLARLRRAQSPWYQAPAAD